MSHFKILILDIKENSKLLQELKREYINENFLNHIKDLLNNIIIELNINSDIINTPELLDKLRINLLFIINKILLDNIFKYIVYKNINNFINLINNNTFYIDLYIRYSYINQVIEVLNSYFIFIDEEKYSIENIINYKLKEIINNFYLHNANYINPILICLFNSLYNSIGHINFNYYKFELDKFNRPMILYTEKDF